MKARPFGINRCLLFIATVLMAGSALAAKPYAKEENSWITLDGTVVASDDDSFLLDYGEDLITVEMDDWNWYEEGHLILDGDKVTVTGRIDDALMEKRTIEAGTVYVDNLNSYFYASPADEELDPYVASTVHVEPLTDGSRVNLIGEVVDVNGREFTLDTGVVEIRVDTIEMPYNPLDQKGFQKLSKGDSVSVNGQLDLNFFENAEVHADSIVSLNRDMEKSNASS